MRMMRIGLTIAIGLGVMGVACYATRPAREPRPSCPTAKVQRGNLVRTISQGDRQVGRGGSGRAGDRHDRVVRQRPRRPAQTAGLRFARSPGHGPGADRPDDLQCPGRLCPKRRCSAAKSSLSQLQASATRRNMIGSGPGLRPSRPSPTPSTTFPRPTSAWPRPAAAGVAAIQEAEATLRIARTNLAYTTIKSPSDGVIIDRRVNVGQTVVASFNAPGLFLIAKDSRHMQVWASVGEADIGDIRPGLPVRFTVNACMDEAFDGKVAQIRMNPVRHDAAITYTVVVAAENLGEMLPDMTANLQFEVEHHPNVLLIPNNAICLPPQSPQRCPTRRRRRAARPARASDATTFSLAKLSGARAARLWKEQRMHHHLWVKAARRSAPSTSKSASATER